MSNFYKAFFITLETLFAAWFLMLGIGVLHGWWSFIPTMGYGYAFAIAALWQLKEVVGLTCGVLLTRVHMR